MRSAYFNCVDQSEASICFHNFFSGSGSRVCTSVLFVFFMSLHFFENLHFLVFFVFFYFFILYFCTFILFVLSHLVGQSIWTSMQNLESAAKKMTELWVLLYLHTFCTFVICLDYRSIQTSMQNVESVAQKMAVIALGTKVDTYYYIYLLIITRAIVVSKLKLFFF